MIHKQIVIDAIKSLKNHPFTVIQLSDKEKFHTGMLCYTLNRYPSLFKTLFGLNDKKNKASVEENSVDLIIRDKDNNIKVVVESKFKTGVHKSPATKEVREKGKLDSTTKYICQLEKMEILYGLKKNDVVIKKYFISIFKKSDLSKEWNQLLFTGKTLSSLKDLMINIKDTSKAHLILLWIDYLEKLKVIVDYFIENKMTCINLKNSVPPDNSSLSGLLKGIKLNGVFESYRYGLVQQIVKKNLSDKIRNLLKISCKNRNELEQVGMLFNTRGNGGIHYAFGGNEKSSFGIQWQGVLKLFIETENKSSKTCVETIYKKLLGVESLKHPSLGKFSSITIKNDWDIYGNIKERPEVIVKYLELLNHPDILKIVKKQE